MATREWINIIDFQVHVIKVKFVVSEQKMFHSSVKTFFMLTLLLVKDPYLRSPKYRSRAL